MPLVTKSLACGSAAYYKPLKQVVDNQTEPLCPAKQIQIF